MHVQANGLHQRWSSIPNLLQALWHALLVLVLGLVTALVGYLMALVPWPFVG
jgi:hypothetical protein